MTLTLPILLINILSIFIKTYTYSGSYTFSSILNVTGFTIFFNFSIIALLLSLILGIIPNIMSKCIYFSADQSKLARYECGFDPFDNSTESPFDIHFFIIGVLFLLFDVEIALLFPWICNLYISGFYITSIICIFIAILLIGFFYEWERGALKWT